MAERDNQSIGDMDAEADLKHYNSERQEFERQAREWRKDAKRYTERYRNDDTDRRKGRRFNIFWSNVDILQAATFGQTPQPDVRRRWSSQDDPAQKIARDASIVLEKTLRYGADQEDEFEIPIDQCNLDALIAGMGQCRVRVDKEFTNFEDGSQISTDQSAPVHYVYWDAFRWSPARIWKDVWWIEYDHLMTRDDLRAFRVTSSVANELPLEITVSAREGHQRTDEKDHREPPSSLNRALIYERWDRRRQKRIWMCKGWPKVLAEEDPPARFEGFFDCPEPLIYNRTNDVLLPIPDYNFYRDLHTELDDLTNRIAGLATMVKYAGFYDKMLKEFPQLADAADGQFEAVDAGAASGTTGGLEGKVLFWPFERAVVALRELYIARDQVKQSIYEITGISDIVRGSSNPNETLGAQELKASFGNLRLQGKQKKARRFVTKIYQLQGEVMSEVAEPDTLARITGEEITPEIMALLRDDQMRGYRVDVSLEDMVRIDEAQQKEDAVEFTTAVTSYFETALPMVAQVPTLAPLVGEMGKQMVRQFKAGRRVEEVFEETLDRLTLEAQQPKPPPQPEPDTVLQEQADSQRNTEDNQTELAKEQMRSVTQFRVAQMAREGRFEG